MKKKPFVNVYYIYYYCSACASATLAYSAGTRKPTELQLQRCPLDDDIYHRRKKRCLLCRALNENNNNIMLEKYGEKKHTRGHIISATVFYTGF
jgi:hypothetical protein